MQLNLCGSSLGDGGAQAISTSPSRSSTFLRMRWERWEGGRFQHHTSLAQHGKEFFGGEWRAGDRKALARNTTLTKINLAHSSLGDATLLEELSTALVSIGKALEDKKTLTALDLEYNHMYTKVARRIANALQVNHVLTSVCFAESDTLFIGEEDED